VDALDRSAPTFVLWTQVATGFYVASSDGAFIGSVDAGSGVFLAVDGHGASLGRFTSLREAKNAVQCANEGPRPRLDKVGWRRVGALARRAFTRAAS
jgi:hypothetical protein